MNRSHFTPLTFFIGSIVFLLAIAFQSQASTVSGTVVDEKGNPVPDITITIDSFKGNFLPGRHHMFMHRNEPVFPRPQPSVTDATGTFSIKNIVSPSVNLLKFSRGHESDYEVQSIEMQGITFNMHPHHFHWHGGFPFGIEEETDKINVKFTVRLRMRIRGQVLSDDGTPLSNARVGIEVKSRREHGGTGSSSGTTNLDADGNFTHYVNSAAYYTVTVTYQGQSAQSKEILLEEGQRLDGLTLTLKGNPEQPRKPQVVKARAVRVRAPERMQAMWKRQQEGVWAINPANRHAYKRINCQTLEDALEQATAQGAHLIAINDKAEQEWILDVFGKENYWIGLTDGAKEGDKQWDNGDAVTYTNWDTQQLLPAGDKSTEKEEKAGKTFTVLIGVTGKWQQARKGSPVASITEKAILEKADMIIGVPKPDEDAE